MDGLKFDHFSRIARLRTKKLIASLYIYIYSIQITARFPLAFNLKGHIEISRTISIYNFHVYLVTHRLS